MTTTSNTSSTSTASTCSNTMAVPSSSSTSTSSMFKPTLGLVAKDVKRLFKPYHGRQSGSTSKWTHKFFCLSSNESVSFLFSFNFFLYLFITESVSSFVLCIH